MSVNSDAVGARPSQRIGSFDGARGVMALLVAVWHCFLLISPAIVVWVLAHPRSPGSVWWYIVDPSEFLKDALVVFFILSGVVLTLPAMKTGFSWWSYYPSRLLRLYLPAWASLVLGILLIVVFPRGHVSHSTWLGGTNATHVDVGQALWQATLFPQSPTINNPLWAMLWEVAFSAFLPLFLLVSLKTTRGWLWMIAAAVAASAIGEQLNIPALMFMPTFLVGSIAGANIDKVMAVTAAIRSSRWHALWWWLILVLSLASIAGSRITDQMSLVKPFTLINHVLASTTVIGYMGLLLIAMGSRSAIRFLTTRPLQWLAGISYSLYLVHVPILASLGFALRGDEWLVPIIGLPLAIATALLFSRFVEWPSHRFGKRVGRALAARVANRSARIQLVTGAADERSSG